MTIEPSRTTGFGAVAATRRIAALRSEELAFWAILALGAALRLVHFGTVPGGLQIDEASVGVEAYSIAHFGVDRWNNFLPVYFPAWGSGLQPLYVYLTVPFVKLMGLTVPAIRMVALIAGIVLLPLVHWGARLAFGRGAALLAMGFLAVLPWQVMASRWGLDSNLLPFCVALGLGTLMVALCDDAPAPARWVALLPWAFAIYAYTAVLLALPLLGVLLVAVYWRAILRAWRDWAIAAVAAGLVALPMALFIGKNYVLKAPLPFESVLPFSLPLFPASRLEQAGFLAGKWILAKNALFALSMFQDGIASNASRFFPPLSLLVPPLAVAGFVFVAIDRALRQRALPVLLVTLALGAQFSLVELNINRANAFLLLVVLLAAPGAVKLFDLIESPRLRPLAAGLGALVLGLSSGLFTHYYFSTYRTEAAPLFATGYSDMVDAAIAAGAPGEPILLVTADMGQAKIIPYIRLLVDHPEMIRRFEESVTPHVVNGVYQVDSFDRFVFDRNAPILTASASYLYIAHPTTQLCAGAQMLASSGNWIVARCVARPPATPTL